MKIQKIIFKDTGPLNSNTYDFTDNWTGKIADKILLSGPNGSGKSIMLGAIAMLWDAAGYWLDMGKRLPASHPARVWLKKWGGIAVILQEIPNIPSIGLAFGESSWIDTITASHPEVHWMGDEWNAKSNKQDTNIIPGYRHDNWCEARKRLVLTFEEVDTPNVIYLDAEQRRWVTPKRHIGETASEDPKKRWLVTYQATDEWNTQLEASLITLKTARLDLFHSVISDLNNFLKGKYIDPEIRLGENRLRVRLEGSSNAWHYIDELSAGEHQVLLLIYLLSRWLQPGGIVLIDEPDLHLHPSLVAGLLSELERITTGKNGQLIITSHNPDVWERYETRGLRIQLGDGNG